MRELMMKLASGEAVVVYSGEGRIVLQVRRVVHGADDPVAPSFKSAVTLTVPEALRVASELLAVVSRAL
jgi:hypothetical protein